MRLRVLERADSARLQQEAWSLGMFGSGSGFPGPFWIRTFPDIVRSDAFGSGARCQTAAAENWHRSCWQRPCSMGSTTASSWPRSLSRTPALSGVADIVRSAGAPRSPNRQTVDGLTRRRSCPRSSSAARLRALAPPPRGASRDASRVIGIDLRDGEVAADLSTSQGRSRPSPPCLLQAVVSSTRWCCAPAWRRTSCQRRRSSPSTTTVPWHCSTACCPLQKGPLAERGGGLVGGFNAASWDRNPLGAPLEAGDEARVEAVLAAAGDAPAIWPTRARRTRSRSRCAGA